MNLLKRQYVKKCVCVFYALLLFKIVSGQGYLPPQLVSNSKELNLNGHVKKILIWSYRLKKADGDTAKNGWLSILDFDPIGNLLDEIEYTPKGDVYVHCKYSSSEQGQIVIDQFNGDEKKLNTVILKYNENHNLVEVHRHDVQLPTVDFSTLLKYDKFGDVAEIIASVNNKLKVIDECFFYNELHQKIRSAKTSLRHIIDNKSYFKYNSSGQLTEEIFVDPGDPKYVNSEFKYHDYDQFGNWLNEIEIDYMRKNERNFIMKEFPDSLKKVKALPFETETIIVRKIIYF
jgi:hypothetical protein